MDAVEARPETLPQSLVVTTLPVDQDKDELVDTALALRDVELSVMVDARSAVVLAGRAQCFLELELVWVLAGLRNLILLFVVEQGREQVVVGNLFGLLVVLDCKPCHPPIDVAFPDIFKVGSLLIKSD